MKAKIKYKTLNGKVIIYLGKLVIGSIEVIKPNSYIVRLDDVSQVAHYTAKKNELQSLIENCAKYVCGNTEKILQLKIEIVFIENIERVIDNLS